MYKQHSRGIVFCFVFILLCMLFAGHIFWELLTKQLSINVRNMELSKLPPEPTCYLKDANLTCSTCGDLKCKKCSTSSNSSHFPIFDKETKEPSGKYLHCDTCKTGYYSTLDVYRSSGFVYDADSIKCNSEEDIDAAITEYNALSEIEKIKAQEREEALR